MNRAIGIDALKIFQFKLAKSRLHALFVFNFTFAYLRFSFVLFCCCCWTSEYSTWLRISVRETVAEFMADEHTKFSGISGLSLKMHSILWTVNVVYFCVTMMIKLNKRQTNKERPTDQPTNTPNVRIKSRHCDNWCSQNKLLTLFSCSRILLREIVERKTPSHTYTCIRKVKLLAKGAAMTINSLVCFWCADWEC